MVKMGMELEQDYRPIIFVSYAYSTKGQKALLEGLKEIGNKNGFDLRLDKEAVRYGGSFKAFMGEMGRSKHVIILASEEYFQSFYCMTELIEVHNNQELKTRVVPIWMNGIKPNQGVFQTETKQFWGDVHDQLENGGNCDVKAATLAGAEQISAFAEEGLCAFGGLRGIEYDKEIAKSEVDVEKIYQKIIRRILFPTAKNKNKGISRCADNQFLDQVKDKVSKLLKASPVLSSTLREDLECNSDYPIADLASDLCARANQDCYSVIDYTLFDAVQHAHEKMLDGDKNREKLFESAKVIACCLVLFSVDESWLQSWGAETHISNMRLDLEMDTISGALIVTSRLHQRIPEFFWEKDTTQLYGKDELKVPVKPTGWSTKKNVDQVIQNIWNQINPGELNKKLTEEDIAELNRQLERLYRRKLKQHYISNAGGDYAYIRDPDVLYGIQHFLPSLVILLLEDKSGNAYVALHNDKKLVGSLRDFFKHLHEIGTNV